MFIIYINKYCNIRLHLISIIIVLSISLSLAENINDYASLNKKNGLYYKNFSNEPYTGSVLGIGIQAVTATGANQSNGASIAAAGGTLVNVTAADNTKCVVLPLLSAVTVGTMYLIFNNAASNTLEVFGGVGDAIGPAGDDTAITIAADTIMLCVALDGTQWGGAELPVIGA